MVLTPVVAICSGLLRTIHLADLLPQAGHRIYLDGRFAFEGVRSVGVAVKKAGQAPMLFVLLVIPAKAGLPPAELIIQLRITEQKSLDPGLRRDDEQKPLVNRTALERVQYCNIDYFLCPRQSTDHRVVQTAMTTNLPEREVPRLVRGTGLEFVSLRNS